MAAAVVAIAPFVARSSILEAVDTTALRVCADPSNLPFSNKAGEGFENKIAEVLAKGLGVPVRYTWFPQVMGFVRNTLRARKCDIIIGVVGTDELVQNTNAYYRSVYVLVHRSDAGLAIDELKDPALQDLRIGVAAGTPPATLLARYGLVDQVEPYHLQVDTRYDAPGKSMVQHVADGTIDVAVLWGPIGGYYAQQHDPPLTVVPLLNEPSDVRMDYRITMGVRYGEPEWKHQINDLIREHQDEIDAILADYGVPLLDRQGKLVKR